MLLIPTFASEMSGVLSKLLDEQFLPLVARVGVKLPLRESYFDHYKSLGATNLCLRCSGKVWQI